MFKVLFASNKTLFNCFRLFFLLESRKKTFYRDLKPKMKYVKYVKSFES